MAVPKTRVSKSKKRKRKSNWKRKMKFEAKKSYSLTKVLLKQKSNSFIYNIYNITTD
uniref:Large ribosomal subunit protein bL32c n=1 Tax=Astrosyne radiata TaxID=1158023 RepID=A0A2U9NT77_9STRA|nr:ribosomal protein L32 [Astrosyne radiata]YP_009497675.1 ribosomal protein L32 [Astrosyne radiata]AWT40337.1 ribosomal protein L32 [Astrosyne radiata]AWT40388.1 ribosomal protein L32 [Astrosyne radiata]